MSLPTPPAAAPGRPVLGIALAVTSVALFAMGDTITKSLAMRHPVEQIGVVRFAVGLVLLLVFVAPRLGARLWRVERLWLVLLRGFLLAVMTLIIGYALRLLPVGETIAIMYLAPFAVMALAVPLLGESVPRIGWFLAALGFAGVLTIVRPGTALNPQGVTLALILAAGNTAFHLITRVLSRTETAIALLFHVTVVGLVVFAVAAVPTLDEPLPGLVDLGLMAFLGVIFTVGHFLFGFAYREAPASLIAPANYLHFVWATLMGWVAFGHVPDGLTAVGMAMILVSGMAIALMAHLHSRRQRRFDAAREPVVMTQE
ncbi:MAG: DMT family transporter [Rhodobacter sp.]|nr:DMT family transporter [Paracoccaceae bacterium]MCC0076908.1 DMT family transporter [Rhodobacter sp.]